MEDFKRQYYNSEQLVNRSAIQENHYFRSFLSHNALSNFQDNNGYLENELSDETSHSDSLPVNKKRTTGIIFTSLNITNVIIGSGVIVLPVSFCLAGLGLASILLILSMGLGFTTIMYVAKLSDLTGKDKYASILQPSFKLPGMIIVNMFQFINSTLAVLTYAMVSADNYVLVMQHLGHEYYARREIMLLVFVFATITISMIKNFANFKIVSLLSVFCVAFYTFVVVYNFAATQHKMFISPKILQFSQPEFMQAFSMLIFASTCQMAIARIYQSSTNPTIERFQKSTIIAITISELVYFIIGTFGYLTFSGYVQGNLLNEYCSNSIITSIARALFIITLIFTAPCQLIVAREGLRSFYEKHETLKHYKYYLRSLISCFICSIIYLIGIYVTNLGLVVSISGAIISTPLIFIFPPLGYLLAIRKHTKNKYIKAVLIIMTIFGIAVSILGAYYSAVNRTLYTPLVKYFCDEEIIIN